MTRVGMADVVVSGVLVAAFVGVAGAAVVGQREANNRVACAKNLKQIGLAVLLYANENRNAYPRTPVAMGKPPVCGTPYADDGSDAKPSARADAFIDDSKDPPGAAPSRRPKPNDVTAPLWLLVRTQDLLPNVFICPSTRLKPITFDHANSDRALNYTNFPGRKGVAEHLSYSYQNPYPTADAIGKGFKLNNSISADFAVMADMNPGSDGLLTLPPTATFAEIVKAKGNSLNHRGEGQNVLFGDGHVEFEASPFVGIGRDNIYVANDAPLAPIKGFERKTPAFAASPADANDSILLPTAADVGQDLALAPVAPAAAADVAAMKQAIAGKYARPPTPQEAGAQRGATGLVKLYVDADHLSTGFGPQQFSAAYEVAGRRGDAIVVTLKGTGLDGVQVDFTPVGARMYIDSDEPTGLLVGDAGAGPGWAKTER